ncbi:hypothetical protein HNP48_001939 [Acidovorax soli]|uniref:TniQ domain-containing protein n=1 Tax=Acidovorax soli TaxID=592050 RepID=A0A7X0PC94_9BURK|nr:TniQ family protein [Acidovorax soli]MBB6559272.1 hypothetical protein [Acidovorax soli]
MLVQPAPLPEEVDSGYLGRIMRINGYLTPKETRAAMEVHFGEEGRKRRDLNVHELLCRMAAMSSEQFAQNHTTLPLRRGITSYLPELRHGSMERSTVMRTTTMQSMLSVAFFCEECVKADIRFHGVSYWRRDHQTPGQLWCPKHCSALHFTTTTEAFSCSPAQFLGQCEAVPRGWVQAAQGNPYVQRYLELAAALYERELPLSVPLIVPVLRATAKSQGFQAHAGAVKAALVSDRIQSVYPREWLGTVFRELAERTPGSFMHQIDGALYLRTSSSSVAAYLLVLGVLFDSPDEAINQLDAANSGRLQVATLREKRRHQLPSQDALLQHYVNAAGVHSEVAKVLGRPIFVVKRVLTGLGLPNLPRNGSSEVSGRHAGLVSFYVSKRSVSESAAASGMSERRFESLIRGCGPNMAKALVMMDPHGKLRPRPAKSTLAGRVPMTEASMEIDASA